MGSTLKLVTCVWFLQTCIVLLSGQQDTCRECQRSPSSCRKIAGIFMVTVLTKGTYNPVVEIPAGACQINITELGPSANYLAVKTRSSKSIINGYWSMVPTGVYKGAGTLFRYGQKTSRTCPGQCVFTDGSLNESVVIQLLYNARNPGIAYEFLLPNYIPFTPYEGTYVPPNSKTVHHRQRHRPQTNRRDRTRHVPQSALDGEYSTSYNSRSEGQPVSGYHSNTQELRAGGTAVYDRRHRQRQSYGQSSRANVQPHRRTSRRYGYDTLGGRGLSYQNAGYSQSASSIQEAQRPRYVSPYDSSGRFTGHETLGAEAALTGRTYVRGEEDTHARSSDNEIGSLYGRQEVVSKQRNVNTGTQNQYMWRISGFTQCSKTCGGGQQQTQIVCVSKNSQTQVTVTEDNCNNAIKPSQQRVQCNTNPCAPDWEVEEWSECSVTCGSGTHTRRVECKQLMSPRLHLSVSASQCDGTRKPAIAKQCEKGPCAKWKTSKWGKCSVSCGKGERRRKVKCVDHQGQEIPDRFCETTPPRSVKQCDQGTCQKQWWTSRWSHQCSNECGSGVKTRSVICASKDGVKLLDSMCEGDRKPQTQTSCRSQSACGGKWFSGPWGKCSAACGEGVRRRDVVCMKVIGSAMSITVDDNCDSDDKPIAEEQCRTDSCGSEWYMAQWSECSVTCGNGMKTREVKCLDQNLQRSRSCHSSSRPVKREACQMRDCHLPQATRFSPQCEDKYLSCRVVLQARLCSYQYYKKICCATCKSAHT